MMRIYSTFLSSPSVCRYISCLALALLFVSQSSRAQLSGNIYNVQGGLNEPTSVAIDSSGNVWIADSNAGTLLENGVSVNPGGTLQWPYQVAADDSGNIYVWDAEVDSVYEISGDSITDIGDNVGPGLASDTTGNVFVGAGNYIEEYSASSSSWSTFGYYSGSILSLAVDSSDNVYVGDYCKVTLISSSSSSTVAGTGTCGNGPSGGPVATTLIGGDSSQGLNIAVDRSGNLFIADIASYVVREVPASSVNIYKVAGNGTHGATCNNGDLATSCEIGPFGVGTDSSGNIYITDFNTLGSWSSGILWKVEP